MRYAVTSAPVITRVCWCRLCQHLGAGNGTGNVGFASADITITGTTFDYVSTANSGNILHRRFCPTCGTQMFSQAKVRPHQIFVRAGTLDDPEIAQPSATIWTKQAPSWACINETLPKIEGQPPPATTPPATS